MTAATAPRPTAPATTSATTAAANRFVAEHSARATAVGDRLADLVMDPDAFVSAINAGLAGIADPVAVDGMRFVAPGIGPVVGVRQPLLQAVYKAFKRGTKRTSTALLLDIAGRLLREEPRELWWFAIWNLERLLPTDPERTWQLLRVAARSADEWITVDTLAHPYGAGVLRDSRRWAELDQLVYSPSRWERRLVGSTLATMSHFRTLGGRDPQVVQRGLALIGRLIGDAEPDVQKALSWALRSFADTDRPATLAFVEAEALTAQSTHDGHRAWVIRDTMVKLPADAATRLRESLDGVRRRPGAHSTSAAAATAAEFASAGTVPIATDTLED
jgi:3-methyladenine DNA glycosylase AlkD